jgi:hypothetical protein
MEHEVLANQAAGVGKAAGEPSRTWNAAEGAPCRWRCRRGMTTSAGWKRDPIRIGYAALRR